MDGLFEYSGIIAHGHVAAKKTSIRKLKQMCRFGDHKKALKIVYAK